MFVPRIVALKSIPFMGALKTFRLYCKETSNSLIEGAFVTFTSICIVPDVFERSAMAVGLTAIKAPDGLDACVRIGIGEETAGPTCELDSARIARRMPADPSRR